MKKLAVLGVALMIGGCATHANIEMPAVTQVYHEAFDNKSMNYAILYSQPKPGILTGGEQLPLVPIEQAQLSVASAATLKKLPDYIFQQLPSTVRRSSTGDSDYSLSVELTAYDKRGPSFADHEAAKSFGTGLLTLGLAPAEYDIVAHFDVKYVLHQGGEEAFSKSYNVNESVDHERGDFESFNSLNDFAGQLLEKHLVLTLNNFFSEATSNLQ